MDEWVLRDEVFAAAHRWPLILLFMLVGSLAGWGLAYLLPAPYQASVEIAVDLNAYRAAEDRYVADYTDAEFRNLDDYKHWQMSQLEFLVRSDAYLQETLNRLREADSSWEDAQVTELRERLKANWRNAGRWRLTAEFPDPEQASQAVGVWKEVILEKTGDAIDESKGMFETELQLRALNNERQAVLARLASLPVIRAALVDWRLAASQQPSSPGLKPVDRWQLQDLAARAAGPDQAWQTLLEELPSPDSPLSAFLSWIDRLFIAIDEEAEVLEARSRSVEAAQAELQNLWENAIPAGEGLSATLIIEPVSQETPHVRQLRPASQAALVGGLVGLLAWALLVLYQITRRFYR